MFGLVFAFVSRRKIWTLTLDGHCIDFTVVIVGSGSHPPSFRLLYICWTITTVLSLQISPKKKIGIVAVSAIGILYDAPGFTGGYFISKGLAVQK
jgi:hypothetical protein